MNKLLIITLAICLVSVHAFVKRDTPAPNDQNALGDLGKNLQDWADNAGDSLKKAFDPEKIKQQFGEALDNINKALDGMKPKEEAPKK